MALKASKPGVLTYLTGFQLREMFLVATRWLEKNAAAIDALNVFPVPDGDTGTNMLLTMKAAVNEAARVDKDNVSLVAAALAHGSLLGARGNSGVILSQILKGLGRGLDDLESVFPSQIALALREAADMAYRGLSQPVEGTMLTVIRDVATAVEKATSSFKDMAGLMEVAAAEAKDSVARTPELLNVLKEAGVVDAGGQGLYLMFAGMAHSLKGEGDNVILLAPVAPASVPPALQAARKKEKAYGYCTEFMVKGDKADPERLRRKLESRGDSLLVVGENGTVKVHIHTTDPGAALKIGTACGSLHDLKIQNMDDQHEDFLQMRRALVPEVKIATVAVVSGSGLGEIFRSLGVTAIVPGGRTMNPSTEDLLRAVEFVPSEKVIVLPNNKNVIPAAVQAASLTKKEVAVLPTASMPEGVAALVAFNRETGMEKNVAEMERAFRRSNTVEIAVAVRAASVGKLRVRKGQYIGFVAGELVAAGAVMEAVILKSLNVAGAGRGGLLTVYYGTEVTAEAAVVLVETLRQRFPNLQIETVNGGQPHYSYIMSLE